MHRHRSGTKRLDPAGFLEPSVEYRPAIFWSWNGSLEAGRLIRQIGQMKDAGLGGFFMHAREGMKKPYLKPEWFDTVRICVDEAERAGLHAWIYDELGWPSGYAGGEVPRKGSEFRAKALHMKTAEVPETDEYRLLMRHPIDAGEYVYFYEWTAPLGNPRYEGASYVDLLYPEVTEAFLQSTHRRYEEREGERFGSVIPGIFSDEACVLMWEGTEAAMLPWTSGLEQLFREAYGYELAPSLPSLVYPEGEYRRIRHDYWKLIVGLLLNHYSKTVYDWCEAKGLAYTGHYMAEDHLWKTMRFLGDTMPHYEYMHIPGMDYLGRQVHKTDLEFCPGGGTVMTAKQVASVAHQLSKPRALSELFGGAGQDYDLRLQKWMIDWHLVHGINVFTPHLLPYSVLGLGKRDWPPVIGPQQPWWEHYRLLNDYQTRMSYALTCGRRMTSLLVIHPAESAWEAYSPIDLGEVERLDRQLGALSLALLDEHIDFDFGNEHLLEKYGEAGAAELSVGACTYKGVVIPACLRLRDNTVALLRRFAESGGAVWSYEPVGQLKANIPELSALPVKEFDLTEIAEYAACGIRVEGENSRHIWLHERIDGESNLHYMANLSLHHKVGVNLTLVGRKAIWKWDACTGQVEKLNSVMAEGRTELAWTFGPGETLLLTSAEAEEETRTADRSGAFSHRQRCASVPLSFEIAETGLNALVLDRYENYDAASGKWSPGYLTAALRQGRTPPLGSRRFRAVLQMDGEMPSDPLHIAAEPDMCEGLSINGHLLSASPIDWIDPEFVGFEIPAGLLRQGSNEIEFSVQGGKTEKLENMYVLGLFEVSMANGQRSFAITKRRAHQPVADDNLVQCGYPFFSGKIKLCASFQLPVEQGASRWLLTFDRPSVSGMKLHVNSRCVGSKAWGPWEWDITDCLTDGANRIEVEIVNTLRNLLGPHHTPDDEKLQYLRPGSFSDDAEDYYFRPFGLGASSLIMKWEESL